MRRFWSFIYVANVFIVLHLACIAIGESIKAASAAPLCEGAPRGACAYISGTQETLSDIAAKFGITTGMLLITNPSVPLFWPVPPSTRIWIPLSSPGNF